MYIDALNLLCDAQAFTADAVSTNSLDLGNVTPKRQIGSGEPMAVTVQVDVSADNTSGTETYSFEVIQSANDNLGTPTVIARQNGIAATTLVAGYVFVIPIPPGFPTARYLGLNFDGSASDTPTITKRPMARPCWISGRHATRPGSWRAPMTTRATANGRSRSTRR